MDDNSLYSQFMRRPDPARCRCILTPVLKPDPAGTVKILDEAGNPLTLSDSPVNLTYSNYTVTTASREPVDLDPAQLEAAIKALGEAVEARLMASCFTTPPDVEAVDWAALLNPDVEAVDWAALLNPDPEPEPERFKADDLWLIRRRFGLTFPPANPGYFFPPFE